MPMQPWAVLAWIADVIEGLKANPEGDAAVEARVAAAVKAICAKYPVYGA